MAFCDSLKKAMIKKNMRAADLARASGLSEAIISEYLSGKKEPRGKQGVALSKALGVSLDDLWDTGFSNQADPADGKSGIGGLDSELTERLLSLTPDEWEKVDAFVQGLLASR